MTGWGGFYDLGIHGHQTVTELSVYFQLPSITSTGPGSQSSVPGPPRKTSFHRRDPDLIQGKTTGFTYKHSPHSTSASNPSAFHLTGKVLHRANAPWQGPLSFAFFLSWEAVSSLHSFLTGGQAFPFCYPAPLAASDAGWITGARGF